MEPPSQCEWSDLTFGTSGNGTYVHLETARRIASLERRGIQKGRQDDLIAIVQFAAQREVGSDSRQRKTAGQTQWHRNLTTIHNEWTALEKVVKALAPSNEEEASSPPTAAAEKAKLTHEHQVRERGKTLFAQSVLYETQGASRKMNAPVYRWSGTGLSEMRPRSAEMCANTQTGKRGHCQNSQTQCMRAMEGTDGREASKIGLRYQPKRGKSL